MVWMVLTIARDVGAASTASIETTEEKNSILEDDFAKGTAAPISGATVYIEADGAITTTSNEIPITTSIITGRDRGRIKMMVDSTKNLKRDGKHVFPSDVLSEKKIAKARALKKSETKNSLRHQERDGGLKFGGTYEIDNVREWSVKCPTRFITQCTV